MLYEKNFNRAPRATREKELVLRSLRNLSLLKENNSSCSALLASQKKQPKIKNSKELRERLVLKETERLKQSNLKPILRHELSSSGSHFRESFLARHKIDCEMRAKMVDWNIEVLCSFNCEPSTFFSSIDLLDAFLLASPRQLHSKEVHLIGVTCMLIASKMEEVLPFKVSTVVEKMTHNKLQAAQIQAMEFEILSALDFRLLKPKSLFSVVELLFVKLNFFRMERFAEIRKVFLYLSKMALHDYDLLRKYSSKYLAASILYITCKIIEQARPGLDIDAVVEKLKALLQLSEETFFSSSEDVLALAKNFERRFPQAKNLLKYDSFQVEKLK